jgi:hypothetical protein
VLARFFRQQAGRKPANEHIVRRRAPISLDGDDALTTLAIGGIFGLLGFLILPALVVFGYLVGVIRRVSEGDEALPPFDEWGELLIDGLAAFVIVVVYVGVPSLALSLVVTPFSHDSVRPTQ